MTSQESVTGLAINARDGAIEEHRSFPRDTQAWLDLFNERARALEQMVDEAKHAIGLLPKYDPKVAELERIYDREEATSGVIIKEIECLNMLFDTLAIRREFIEEFFTANKESINTLTEEEPNSTLIRDIQDRIWALQRHLDALPTIR